MKLKVLEFNRSSGSSIDEFSDLLQKSINQNNDLMEFKAYENPYNGSIVVELLFGLAKTKAFAVSFFGVARTELTIETIQKSLDAVNYDEWSTRYVSIVPLTKSARSVGFLVLEKKALPVKEKESAKAEKRKQDSKVDGKSNRG